MDYFYDQDTSKVQQAAVTALEELLSLYQESETLFMVSGGSSLELLDLINADLLGSWITLSVLDERFSTDPEANNYQQLTQTKFYSDISTHNIPTIDTTVTDGEDIDDCAINFEMQIREWDMLNPDGKVIIIQGVGEDGHTSGVLPFPEDPNLFNDLFLDEEVWVMGYETVKAKNKYPARVTTTLSFLQNRVDHSIVYLSGAKKAQALQQMQEKSGSLAEIPARTIHEMKDVQMFTDIA